MRRATDCNNNAVMLHPDARYCSSRISKSARLWVNKAICWLTA